MLLKQLIVHPFSVLKAGWIGRKNGIKCVVDPECPFLKINIHKCQTASLKVKGLLYFTRFLYSEQPINIILKENSTFEVESDLMIGSGTTILVGENAFLRIGGKLNERIDGAAILGSTISVRKKITIGYDCMTTVGVMIIDSNFHHLEYNHKPVEPDAEVNIGDNVWILPNATILKGSTINEGCIIGHRSVVTGKSFPDHCFIAGTPAKIVKSDCSWRSTMD